MYKIIQKKKIWFIISGLLVASSIVFLSIWGLNFGIDFTGGSLLEVKFDENRPTVIETQDRLSSLNLDSLIVQPVGEKNMILRFQDTNEEKHQEVLVALGNVEEMRFDSVGPSIGAELKRRSVYAVIAVLVAIILYIAWAFRKVSKPVASWKYGLAAIVALFHDILIVLGTFAILGRFFNIEINTPFIAAILTVLGYSVNDTIVVFDRARENLPKSDDNFEETVNASVNQTITRSINTSITTLLVLITILIFGGESIRDFVLALSIGVFIGTYSSIFLASPLLVSFEKK
ncbi:protein translocase subunit SecF [Candidatus Falkowbacteria bacterium]|nr:protein translocase subunit SecF [Candidatus Falkowbacteria bacterium]